MQVSSPSGLAKRLRDLLDRLPYARSWVIGGLIGAMIVLGVLMAQNNFSQNAARYVAKDEGDALIAIYRLQATLTDLEAGQRGYILTGNPAYLTPYTRARSALDGQVSEVRSVMAGRISASQSDINRFEQIARDKLVEIDKSVSLARSGEFGLAGDIVRSNLGKRDMDMLRAMLGQMADSQTQRRADAFARANRLSSWLLPLILGLWAMIGMLGWSAIHVERRRADVLIETERAEQMRLARDRAQLVAGEMNHRIKNLFAVVLSIIQLSSRREGTAREILTDVTARVRALLQAHEAALANEAGGADLRQLAERTIAPYRDGARATVSLDGQAVMLPQTKVTPMALILHELATNAAKYGALSANAGHLALTWTCESDGENRERVHFVWCETGGPPVSPQASQPGKGFGSRMTTMAAAQLAGTLEREWPETGARVVIDFPI